MVNIPNKSSHILDASTNLIGFSLIVLTSLKVLNLSNNGFVDEVTAVSITIFMISTLFSFLSMRSPDEEISKRRETIADYTFLTGLLLLFIVCILLTWHK